METIHAACEAMATRFEFVLHGANPIALRAAAEEAIREINRLHSQLSLYLPSSEISYINSRAARQEVKVEPQLFALLQLAQRVHHETGGTFDITIAPLMRCWGFMGGSGSMPTPAQLAEARARVGMTHVVLDESRRTIRFAREGMMIDLGSIGKGYALEVATEILRDAGVTSALLHGGTSTVCAIGTPPDGVWKVAIERTPSLANVAPQTEIRRPLAVVELHDAALSVSAVHGKHFCVGERVYGHVIDPRTGEPGQGALLAAVMLPSATETDAFSTALLLGGFSCQDAIVRLRPEMRTLVLGYRSNSGELTAEGRGVVPLS